VLCCIVLYRIAVLYCVVLCHVLLYCVATHVVFVKVKFIPEQASKAQRGSRNIALLIL